MLKKKQKQKPKLMSSSSHDNHVHSLGEGSLSEDRWIYSEKGKGDPGEHWARDMDLRSRIVSVTSWVCATELQHGE